MSKKKAFTVKMAVNNNLRIFTIIRLVTKNDTNGNPRRCQLVINTTPSVIAPLSMNGNIISAVAEGYIGESGTRKKIEKALEHFKQWHTVLIVTGPQIETTPSEYRATLKQHRDITNPTTDILTKKGS